MERRKRSRIEGRFTATLLAGDREFPVQTVNLSLKGLLAAAFPGCADLVGQECFVHLSLARDIFIVIEARVVRAEAGQLAVEYLSMPDEESYAHLRSIVRLHSGDADRIDREQMTPAFGRGDGK